MLNTKRRENQKQRKVWEYLHIIVVLFKLRVVMLLLFAATGGLMLASSGRPESGALGLLLLTGTMSAGGAGALNEVIEREADAKMRRTRRRPLVTGAYDRAGVAALAGVGLVIGAVLLALAAGNPALAFFLGLGAFFYVGVYTLWLKPRTPLNIVLGGFAGSCAVLSGGAAAGGWDDPGALLLAVLLMMWNPAHFWSLALAYREDYVSARVPMLPAVMPVRRVAGWIAAHAGATAGLALAIGVQQGWGALYLLPVGLGSLWLARKVAPLLRDQSRGRAFATFTASNLYLALVLAAIWLCATFR
jgi:protoheme IX farnesyltransferase